MNNLPQVRPCAVSSRKLPAGFTLVEVLIAIVLVGIGCMAAIALQASAMKGGYQADQLTVASFLAESQIEALKATPQFNNIAVGIYSTEYLTREGTRCTAGASRCSYTRTTKVTDRKPTSRSRWVAVEVSWKNIHGAGQTVTYETAITNLTF